MPRIAVLAATPGHSGVDRLIGNLVRQFDLRGFGMGLLKIRGHGPICRRMNWHICD